MRHSSPPALFGLLLVLGGLPAAARVKAPTISELVRAADAVVIGRVVEVEEIKGERIAWVEVVQQLLGEPLDRFALRADPTWACDISDAEPGEMALLFVHRHDFDGSFDTDGMLGMVLPARGVPASLETALGRRRGGLPLMDIVYSGRGRLPIRWVQGNEQVEYSEVRLAEDVRMLTVSWSSSRFARLDDVLDRVREAAAR